ncbi:hypothetical protein TELCIR_13119, partial [Teladorsagia circumcincta]
RFDGSTPFGISAAWDECDCRDSIVGRAVLQVYFLLIGIRGVMAQISSIIDDINVTEICVKNGLEVVTFPYYRVMQCLHIVLCLSSIGLLLWVLGKYRSKLMFHYNIRTYQLFLSFTYEAPCDVILPRLFYMSIHLPYTFSVLWIEGAQIVMVMERIIAIFYVGQYETCTKKLGNSLLFFSLFFPLTEVIWAYVDETFEEPQISCLNTPMSRTKQINTLFIFAIAFHIVAILAIVIAFLFHRQRTR